MQLGQWGLQEGLLLAMTPIMETIAGMEIGKIGKSGSIFVL